LKVGDNTYTIPPQSNVQVNFCGLHANTSVWGDSALTWNPNRFIDTADPVTRNRVESEQLRNFADGEFIPWSHGERVCPGKRFSQVELAAVLAVLFRGHRVEPVPEAGENLESARERIQRISLDIQMTLLNEMYQPERVGLKWMADRL
jgi:cytochrome P450